MASHTRPEILEAALSLFSDFGYFGVTTRQLAKNAGTTEATIYRHFTSKETLFEAVLDSALEGSLGPAQMLLMIHENKRKQSLPALVVAVLQRWYASNSVQSARLLHQASLSANAKWRRKAHARLDEIVGILASAMERETRKLARKFNARAAAQMMVLALFQFKIIHGAARPTRREVASVQEILRQGLQGWR